MINERLRNILLVTTVAAVIIMVLAVVALCYNIISITQLSEKKASLERESARLTKIIEENEDEIEYRQSSEFIESYARDYLGMKYEDEEVYESNQ